MTERTNTKNRSKFWQILLLAALLALPSIRGAAQNLVVDGSFETPYVTNATRSEFFDPTNLSPWQTTATTFEIWTNGWENPAAGVGRTISADGVQNLEIISMGSTNVTIWQTVPTVTGERYRFSFYFSPRPNSSSDLLTVSINSNSVLSQIENGLGLSDFNWQLFTTNFVAASNLTTLAFSDQSLNNGGSGSHIDGVVLEHIPWLTIQTSDGGGLTVSWLGVSNETYQLQFRSNLTAGSWSNLNSPFVGKNAAIVVPVTPAANAPIGFYQVVVLP